MMILDMDTINHNAELLTIIKTITSKHQVKSINITFTEDIVTVVRKRSGAGEIVGLYNTHVPYPFIVAVDKDRANFDTTYHAFTDSMDLLIPLEDLCQQEKARINKDGTGTLLDTHIINAKEILTLEFIFENNKYNKYVLDKGNM